VTLRSARKFAWHNGYTPAHMESSKTTTRTARCETNEPVPSVGRCPAFGIRFWTPPTSVHTRRVVSPKACPRPPFASLLNPSEKQCQNCSRYSRKLTAVGYRGTSKIRRSSALARAAASLSSKLSISRWAEFRFNCNTVISLSRCSIVPFAFSNAWDSSAFCAKTWSRLLVMSCHVQPRNVSCQGAQVKGIRTITFTLSCSWMPSAFFMPATMRLSNASFSFWN
jgi:hypothetical protein